MKKKKIKDEKNSKNTNSIFIDRKYSEIFTYSNLINIQHKLSKLSYGYYSTADYSVFSDKGAWHTYTLPPYNQKDLWASFGSSLIMQAGYQKENKIYANESCSINLSSKLNKLNIYVLVQDKSETDNWIKLNFANSKPSINYYPGIISQKFLISQKIKNNEQVFYHFNISVELDLIFSSSTEKLFSKSSLIRTKIKDLESYQINQKTNNKKLLNSLLIKLEWESNIFSNWQEDANSSSYDLGLKLNQNKNLFNLSFSNFNTSFDNKLGPLSKSTNFAFYFDSEIIENFNYQDDHNKNLFNINICSKKLVLNSQKTLSIFRAELFCFTKKEYNKEIDFLNYIFSDELRLKNQFKLNKKRWKQYISKTIANISLENRQNFLLIPYLRASIKMIQTLITNWRGPTNDLFHSGITPSVSYRWFNGLWGWDTWKSAIAISYFDAPLAKEAIKAMFDYQVDSLAKNYKLFNILKNDQGTIIDAIYIDKNNNNLRNSKPPLAAWAVDKIVFGQDKVDLDFAKLMYPKLKKYHNWWYSNRDFDQNKIAQYGAMNVDLNNVYDKKENKYISGQPNVDEAILAAAWESGMDNATRFDRYGHNNIKDSINSQNKTNIYILKTLNKNQEPISYTINQESVDLNCFLYQEKLFLAKLALLLKKENEANQFKKEALKIKKYINKNMWDEKSGFYYDLYLDPDFPLKQNKKKILTSRGKGTEGFMPLWANIASTKQAKRVKEAIMDDNQFNTFLPFPSAPKNNKKFNPNKYWRGPVWLDQALFGIEALTNYGFEKEAYQMVLKLFNNAEGVMSNLPIRENYNPENGLGLHTTNFSWSAGAYYLFFINVLANKKNTTEK